MTQRIKVQEVKSPLGSLAMSKYYVDSAPYQDVLIVLRRCAPRIAPLTLRGISLCALHKGQFNLRCELRKARS